MSGWLWMINCKGWEKGNSHCKTISPYLCEGNRKQIQNISQKEFLTSRLKASVDRIIHSWHFLCTFFNFFNSYILLEISVSFRLFLFIFLLIFFLSYSFFFVSTFIILSLFFYSLPSSVFSFLVCSSRQVENYHTIFPLGTGSLSLMEQGLNHGVARFTVGSERSPCHGTVSDFWGIVAPFIHHMLSRSCICTNDRANKATSAWWTSSFDVSCHPREKIMSRTTDKARARVTQVSTQCDHQWHSSEYEMLRGTVCSI